ncbi:hypothetical protein [Luteolibacter sp. Populi]|uniref:hypothetical protein n=1 Tax=Luteolibacter sp. Populi TaxID=3230487 RepID=UPI00346509AE
MMWIPSCLAALPSFLPQDPSWSLSFDGISPAKAALILLVLFLATLLAYWRWAPGVRVWKKALLVMLRTLACLILVALLTKPVLVHTLKEEVRQPLAIVVDGSESMRVADHRESDEDLKRAAIAAGTVPADAGLPGKPPDDTATTLGNAPRTEVLQRLATNPQLDLWRGLAEKSDLEFHGFGRSASSIGEPITQVSDTLGEEVARRFKDAQTDDSVTAIGESLRQVLQEPRPQSLGGVLLITDGANNSGSSPLETAMICKEQNVPLFIYGVGMTSPRDVIVKDIRAPKLAFVGERMQVSAHISAKGMAGKSIPVILKADGVEVERRDLAIEDERGQDIALHLVPENPGDIRLEISVPPQTGEASTENNQVTTSVRVTDKKFHVLLIEQEPRWDFRYLLDYLERDRRLEVKCVMIDGEPGLDKIPDSPFLPALPDTREAFFASQVLILGDVNPEDLGEARMQTIAEWVEAGGGIIFLAGANYSPTAYAGTPLEPLLPVVPDNLARNDQDGTRSTEPFQLRLSRAGQQSPFLQMDPDAALNREIWAGFPGVRWTAPILRIRPGAEVLLVDPRPERTGRYGQLPVFAMQGHGSGTCVYFGTDETYRWRSRTGEKYYSILWGQIMQSLALQLLEGASALTQLKTDRKEYAPGNTVTISGKAYTRSYEPYIAPSLEGTITWKVDGKSGSAPLSLQSTSRNAYRGEYVPTQPGSYSFVTARDPEGIVKFEVVDMRLEKTRTALDDRLLRGMAEAAGGHFFREEDLHKLPGLLAQRSATVSTFKKVDLYQSGWILAALLSFLFLEWFVRKLVRLK